MPDNYHNLLIFENDLFLEIKYNQNLVLKKLSAAVPDQA